MSKMSNKAAVLKDKAARFMIEDRPVYEPQEHEILIKVHAVASNPVDWKMQDEGLFVEAYPTILGSDVAGTVEAVGPSVTKYQKGDRVSGFADVLVTKDSRSAAFQEYSIVKDTSATKLPSTVSYEEGSTLPMSVATAGLAIFLDLEIPKPPTKQSGGFLVWGAASSVGVAVVQIARALGYTVVTANSPKHNEYLRQLGASHSFDYNDPEVVKKILSTSKTAGFSLNIGYDAISEYGTSPKAAEVLSGAGGGKLLLVLDWEPEEAKKPDNVELVRAFAARIATDQKELSGWLLGDWLAKSLAEGTYVPAPKVKIVEGGIEGIQGALEEHKKGVSGAKLVVPLK